jgi:hypothetical protein
MATELTLLPFSLSRRVRRNDHFSPLVSAISPAWLTHRHRESEGVWFCFRIVHCKLSVVSKAHTPTCREREADHDSFVRLLYSEPAAEGLLVIGFSYKPSLHSLWSVFLGIDRSWSWCGITFCTGGWQTDFTVEHRETEQRESGLPKAQDHVFPVWFCVVGFVCLTT